MYNVDCLGVLLVQLHLERPERDEAGERRVDRRIRSWNVFLYDPRSITHLSWLRFRATRGRLPLAQSVILDLTSWAVSSMGHIHLSFITRRPASDSLHCGRYGPTSPALCTLSNIAQRKQNGFRRCCDFLRVVGMRRVLVRRVPNDVCEETELFDRSVDASA
jgi:hypothetical protein